MVASDGVSPEGPVDTLSPEEAKESRSLRVFCSERSKLRYLPVHHLMVQLRSLLGLEMKAEES